ncbi:MAG: TetR/AcrR family transcriptional regulator [Bacillota bacterium]
MGLRISKKEKTREMILDCAKKLFFTKGYEETTTDEIAECANVGSGTIYNYFPSKAEMLLAILSEDVEISNEELTISQQELNTSSVELVSRFVEGYLKKFSFFNKKFMLDIVTAMMKVSKYNSAFIKKIASMDFTFIEHLKKYLEELKSKKLLSQDTDPKLLSEIIYSAILYEVIIVLLDNDAPMESAFTKIQEKIEYILMGRV